MYTYLGNGFFFFGCLEMQKEEEDDLSLLPMDQASGIFLVFIGVDLDLPIFMGVNVAERLGPIPAR